MTVKTIRTALLLTLSFSSFACGSAAKSPVLAPDHVASSDSALQLEIRPAVATSPGGMRLPLRFTIRNTGDQTIHTCLSEGRVVHLWGLDREYGYTLAQQHADQPSCEEPFDLPPNGEHAWTEEIAIPAIKSGTAKIVGFAQIMQSEPCGQSGCEPVWLSASYSPFQIQEGAIKQTEPLDVRTGVTSASLMSTSEPAESTGSRIER